MVTICVRTSCPETPRGWPGRGMGLRGLFPLKVLGLKYPRCYQLLWASPFGVFVLALIGPHASGQWNWSIGISRSACKLAWILELSLNKIISKLWGEI